MYVARKISDMLNSEKAETMKPCKCKGEWRGDKYYGTLCERHMQKMSDDMAAYESKKSAPIGYRILGDGPKRFVLTHDRREQECPLFTSEGAAIRYANYLESGNV